MHVPPASVSPKCYLDLVFFQSESQIVLALACWRCGGKCLQMWNWGLWGEASKTKPLLLLLLYHPSIPQLCIGPHYEWSLLSQAGTTQRKPLQYKACPRTIGPMLPCPAPALVLRCSPLPPGSHAVLGTIRIDNERHLFLSTSHSQITFKCPIIRDQRVQGLLRVCGIWKLNDCTFLYISVITQW